MKLNPLSRDTWRHGHHSACPTPIERDPHFTLQDPTANRFYCTLSPGNRRSYLLGNSSNSTQQESLAAPMGLEASTPGVQRNQQPGVALQRLEGEEIVPTDVKYRLQLLEEVPLQRKSASGHSQHYKPEWNLVSKSHREWLKPWKMEDVPHHRASPPMQVSCLPPLKLLSRRVKSKWPPHTPGIFQGKFQAELTGKHFFQDWRAQPQGRYGNNEKPLVPFEDQVHTRLIYMPLFTGRVKLYKPKSNGIKHKTNTFSTEQEKSIRYKGQRQNFGLKKEHLEKETA